MAVAAVAEADMAAADFVADVAVAVVVVSHLLPTPCSIADGTNKDAGK
jgi:hypothetical protein